MRIDYGGEFIMKEEN